MNTVASLPAKLRWMIADANNLGVNERTIDLAVLEEAAAALATPAVEGASSAGEAVAIAAGKLRLAGRRMDSLCWNIASAFNAATAGQLAFPKEYRDAAVECYTAWREAEKAYEAAQRGTTPPTPSAPDREAELAKLRELCGCAYQLAGYHDAPEAWLDALWDAADCVPLAEWRVQGDLTETLLPYSPPSATVVDDGFEAWLDRDWPLWRNNEGHPILSRLRRCWTAALSGVSAPVGVEAVGEVRIQDGCIVSTSIKRPLADGGYDVVPQRLTPPAAATCEETKCVRCGEPTMHLGNVCYACSHPAAAPRGEEQRCSEPCGDAMTTGDCPCTAAREDGLQKEAANTIRWLEAMAGHPAWKGSCGDSPKPQEFREAADLIRRLAASGQGVE